MSQFEQTIPHIHGLPPRMPNPPQREELERKRGIREVVFGVQDGVLTTMGLVTGLGAAANARSTVIVAGLLSLCVGALSMGVGEFLGGKSEQEVVRNAITLERREMIEQPDEEFAEQVGYYRVKGFTQAEAEMIVRRLATNHEIWLHEMMRDEFGIDPRMADDNNLVPALKMAGSFAFGALLPILPHMLPLPSTLASYISAILAALMLFAIGFISGKLSGDTPWRKGLEIVAFGSVVFGISYSAGRFIPPLFGLAPVATGG